MTSTPIRGALTALALVIMAAPGLAGTAAAQTPYPQVGAPGAGDPRAAEHQRMQARMAEHRAMKMRDLHAILNIRPDQEAAFSAFQASMTPPPHDERMKRDWAAMQSLTTPQRLDMMLAHMDQRMAHMRAHIQATKAFYAALSPDQQRAFDALARMHGMRGGHGGGGHWGGPHMGGMGDGPPPPPGA